MLQYPLSFHFHLLRIFPIPSVGRASSGPTINPFLPIAGHGYSSFKQSRLPDRVLQSAFRLGPGCLSSGPVPRASSQHAPYPMLCNRHLITPPMAYAAAKGPFSPPSGLLQGYLHNPISQVVGRQSNGDGGATMPAVPEHVRRLL